MESVQFQTPEYQPDGTFKTAAYEFQGSPFRGWKIFRNGKLSLELEPGFVVVKSLFCGICATDLARRFLPYPLPQIIGHEVVGLVEGTPVVAEINASHRARNRNWQSCPYCSGGLDSHCPDRITLGIDRLPGGFAPYFLVPVKAMMEIPESVSPLAACVTEPLAAALQGVEASLPCPDDKVAVLGPRRLGTLILAALSGFRKRKALDFEIAALVRHPELREICLKMGADRVLNLNEVSDGSMNRSFDIVFDTTGTPEGFAAALDLTRRVLHLKSTNGLEVMGLRHLTDMVVDEIALLPYDQEGMNFTWPIEARKRKNPNIFVSPGVSKEDLEQMRSDYPDRRFFHSTIPETVRRIENTPNLLEKSPLPQFDLAIVKDPDDIDRVLRPVPGETFSLVRPRGAILLLEGKSQKTENQLFQAVTKGGIQIHTSRCGNFERALKIMQENTDLQRTIENHYLTHRLPLNRISKAFETATDSRRCIKAVVEMP